MIEVVDIEASTSSVAVSTGAGDGTFCGWSRAGERTSFSGELDGDLSSPEAVVEALSCLRTRNPQ